MICQRRLRGGDPIGYNGSSDENTSDEENEE
jgi:hypothetical protein